MNSVLSESKRHATVTDGIFNHIQDYVGVIAKEQDDVLEPFLPTKYNVSYLSVETYRKEVTIITIHPVIA